MVNFDGGTALCHCYELPTHAQFDYLMKLIRNDGVYLYSRG